MINRSSNSMVNCYALLFSYLEKSKKSGSIYAEHVWGYIFCSKYGDQTMAKV